MAAALVDESRTADVNLQGVLCVLQTMKIAKATIETMSVWRVDKSEGVASDAQSLATADQASFERWCKSIGRKTPQEK